jgi:hypothetical protein
MGVKTVTVLLLLLAVGAGQVTQMPSSAAQGNSIQFLPDMLSCIAFRAAECVQCPFNYHVNMNQCYKNITGCLRYRLN